MRCKVIKIVFLNGTQTTSITNPSNITETSDVVRLTINANQPAALTGGCYCLIKCHFKNIETNKNIQMIDKMP